MKRELERIDIPGEHEARARTWTTVRTAFERRERVTWPRRHGRALAWSAAACTVVAAALTPPGHSVVNSIRDAVGRTQGVRHAHRELVLVPSGGTLLVDSRRGTWIVHGTGTRRLISGLHDPSWSPHGLFVAGVFHTFELAVVDPQARVRWEKPRKALIRSPRWSFDGYRIAYFASDTLRVINGDGTGDRLIGPADPSVPPVWAARTHVVTYRAGRTVRSLDVDRGRSVRLRTPTVRTRVAVNGARSIVLLGRRQVFSGKGRFSGVEPSPDGRWLLVAWPTADQFVFVRVVGKPKLYAVSNITRQFGSFPTIAGWCCTS